MTNILKLMKNLFLMFSVKSGDPDQINDDHIISKDVNRLTDRFQDPISVQKAVHPSKTKFGLLLKLEES